MNKSLKEKIIILSREYKQTKDVETLLKIFDMERKLDESFQQELNREGVQCDEPDNPKPRIYKDMKFGRDDKAFKKAHDIFIKTIKTLKDGE